MARHMMETEAEADSSYFSNFIKVLSRIDRLIIQTQKHGLFFGYHTQKEQEKTKVLFYLYKNKKKLKTAKKKKIIITPIAAH